MSEHVVIVAVGALAILVLTELVAATLPVVIVIALVPPEEREGLAKLLAVCDSSRKLRLWPALRLAVRARREEASRTRIGGPDFDAVPSGWAFDETRPWAEPTPARAAGEVRAGSGSSFPAR
jgi:hypothetical protein